jgi:DNA-directed RNA polymerase specialized sigma24 family protein
MVGPDDERAFAAFVVAHEARLRRALVAVCGPDAATDAVTDAFVHAWRHWPRVAAMDNPVGYTYRVARSRVPRRRRVRPVFEPGGSAEPPLVEPGLAAALATLSERQRVVVMLHHGAQWTYDEIARLLGIGVSSVRNHETRGMKRLRRILEVEHGDDRGAADRAVGQPGRAHGRDRC